MRAIRSFYFYLVSLISIEVVIWGVIYLLWYTVLRKPVAGSSYLAVGLSLVLVGLPFFLFHWWVACRDAARDDDERFTRIRALFLYVIRLGVLIPCFQNLIAVLNRPILALMGQPVTQALVGGNDTFMDNLAVILVNLVAWYYFERILKDEWKAAWPGNVLVEVRRFSRYLWMLYALGLAVLGIEFVFSFIFYVPGGVIAATAIKLGNALPLVLVGIPLWFYTWRIIQSSLKDKDELFSGLRLGVLYLLSLGGSITTLSTSAYVFFSLLKWVMGAHTTAAEFFNDNNNPLASAIVFGVLWAYFGSRLRGELAARRDPVHRAELSRPYTYILSFLGNGAAFIGAWFLLTTLAELITGTEVAPAGIRSSLAGSIAAIAVGLPVWLGYWFAAQAEVAPLTDIGDHARRSIVRKVYLYLAVFALVVTAMVTAGMFFYRIINTLLGNRGEDFWLDFTRLGLVLVLTLVWLAYHVTRLLQDGRRAQQELGKRHAAYQVIALFPRGDPLAEELKTALKKQAPAMVLKLYEVEEDYLPEDPTAVHLLVLPSTLALDLPARFTPWMQSFTGSRLVLPVGARGWLWQGAPQDPSTRDLAGETAQSIRRMAEGQGLRSSSVSSPMKIGFYLLAGLFGLQLLLAVFSMGMSIFWN